MEERKMQALQKRLTAGGQARLIACAMLNKGRVDNTVIYRHLRVGIGDGANIAVGWRCTTHVSHPFFSEQRKEIFFYSSLTYCLIHALGSPSEPSREEKKSKKKYIFFLVTVRW